MLFLRRSLFLRITFWTMASASLILAAVLGLNWQQVSAILFTEQEARFCELAESCSYQIDAKLVPPAMEVHSNASLFYRTEKNWKGMTELIADILERNPDICGAAITFREDFEGLTNPETGQKTRMLYGWKDKAKKILYDRIGELRNEDGKQGLGDIEESDYSSDWYRTPFASKKPHWSVPYYDKQSDITMVTYSVPVFRDPEKREHVEAILTCDLSLAWLDKMLDSLPLNKEDENEYPVLLSGKGVVLVHPKKELVLETSLKDLENSSTGEQKATYRRLQEELKGDNSGVSQYIHPDTNKPVYFFYNPVKETGWDLGLVIPKARVTTMVQRLTLLILTTGIIGVLLLLIPMSMIALSITRPLKSLEGASNELAKGDFEVEIPQVKTKDEIAHLIANFASTRDSLKHYVEEVQKTTAAREKLSVELNLARKIQLSMVPKLFPPFPTYSGLDLYAILEPAREVGGDLYDFALLEENLLYVCIGDVSGKGVPASLFMAVGKTLLKSAITTMKDPCKAVEHVNNELFEHNDACMFITLFCGIIDFNTNMFTYVSAGHNPPIVVGADGETTLLNPKPTRPLALFDNVDYENHEYHFKNDDMLFLYTDGVTEAMDPDDKIYEEEGFYDFMKTCGGDSAEELVTKTMEQIRKHAAGTPQSDDITMLAVSYNPDAREEPTED